MTQQHQPLQEVPASGKAQQRSRLADLPWNAVLCGVSAGRGNLFAVRRFSAPEWANRTRAPFFRSL